MKYLLVLFSAFNLLSCNSQNKKPIPGNSDYQKELNMLYQDASKSPLKNKDLRKFKGLNFFTIDSTFIVEASLQRIQNAPTFKMATTTDRTALYKEYGILSFTLKGQKLELTVYESQENVSETSTKTPLFLPFTDNTSGKKSYGGGRYMDIHTTAITSSNTVILDFNNTYNPYCAYNEKYSCPLTPRKNHLNIAIEAGIKVFKKL